VCLVDCVCFCGRTIRYHCTWYWRCAYCICLHVYCWVRFLWSSISNRVRFASTWGPGIWVAIGEMFPLHVRSYSASFATAGNWSWNFLLTFFTPFITSAIQFRYGYVFAGCNLIAVVVVFLFYYESSGLALEQVDTMYTDPTVKPWQSSSWIPKGHKSRYDAAEAAKEEQIAGLGSRAATENFEHVNGNDVTRDSMDTQVEVEKEEERKMPLPQFNRNNIRTRGKEEDQIPQTNRGKFNV